MEDPTASAAANNVAAAIAAALDWSSPPDARKTAVSYLESVKSGDIRALASTSLLLVRKNWSSEIRLHGFKMLQHLVRFRWEEFNPTERREFANYTLNLITEVAGPTEEWALKSQTAALVAEVVRREGITIWSELFPSVVSLSIKGPTEAELVAMILRWLPEDITVHNEDLEGDRRRELLRGLTESLSEILPLLYSLLEKHFISAMTEHANQNLESAKQHAATVTAALNAVNAYAEWAPVPDLAKFGLIHGCSSLLPYNEFRLHACEFFKFICQRKRPVDGTALEFDSAMNSTFQILMSVSRDFLNKSKSNPSTIDESEYEFAECILESMVALGSSNMQCIIGDVIMTSQFLQQMLEYYQHYRISLHFQSLLFWLALLREPAKAKSVAQCSGDNTSSSSNSSVSPAEKDRKGASAFITDEICSVILDISLQRMLKKSAVSGEVLELWSDELEGKADFSQYRSRLLDVIKLTSSQKPLIAATRVAQRMGTVLGNTSHLPTSAQETAVVESTQLGLEAVINAVFDASMESVINTNEQAKFQLHSIFEGILQQLLLIKWTEPALVVILGHYLESFGPYLKYFPDSVASVVNKLFELLTCIPISLNDPSSNGARHARLQICTSFIRISLAADKSLLPHTKAIADTMGYLQAEGQLLRGEHNLLCEAFLVTASSAGLSQQQEVLAWLLEPLSKMWTPLEWQNAYLSDQFGLVRLCSDSQFMWSIYHTVTFFEKALKRSGIRKPASAGVPKSMHPVSPHLPWMLPPLLKLIRAIHALWSEPVAQNLNAEMKAAKSMSSVEQASLLGETHKVTGRSQVGSSDGDIEGESKENNIRNWLKGTRDSGYNVIGLSATIGEPFYRSIEVSSLAVALMENIQSMEFRHIRQLIHLVLVPVVKNCPVDLWEVCIVNFLHPLFLHCHQVLGFSWAGLLQEGRAKVPDNLGNLTGLELKVEVMEEKLLRDLTREVCSVLSAIASPGLNAGLPSLEQLGTNRGDQSALRNLESFSSTSLVGFLLLHKTQAILLLRIMIDVLNWTDADAVTRAVPFCRALVLLSIATNNTELRQFVTKDLFSAIIQGLAFESNAFISAELLGLCREIYVYLLDWDPTPRQVLMSLPHIKQEDLAAFEDALSKTMSPKEQKQHMRSLLVLATGNQLKALAAQKSTNLITNVTARTRNPARHAEASAEDGPIGLAAIS
ncbi:Protein HASTY 1 [Rhynchospora pubera]|uniref:Protein HASTY 1 n=1 Tax=Rhynchospora pubera TaxID=906938 RepID=A0AAV8G035_9POAL|nr:Protein HASTY 1 [Rhynchospora pubera]